MFIVVQHNITNKDVFFGAGEAVVSDAPPGVKSLQFFPSTNREQAVCLWEGDSINAVRNYLDQKLGGSSQDASTAPTPFTSSSSAVSSSAVHIRPK